MCPRPLRRLRHPLQARAQHKPSQQLPHKHSLLLRHKRSPRPPHRPNQLLRHRLNPLLHLRLNPQLHLRLNPQLHLRPSQQQKRIRASQALEPLTRLPNPKHPCQANQLTKLKPSPRKRLRNRISHPPNRAIPRNRDIHLHFL